MDIQKPGSGPDMSSDSPNPSPGQGGGASAKLNLDPSDLLNESCNECDSEVFEKIHFVKKISEVVSPNGEEQLLPVPTFRCAECGHINEQFQNFEKDE